MIFDKNIINKPRGTRAIFMKGQIWRQWGGLVGLSDNDRETRKIGRTRDLGSYSAGSSFASRNITT